MKSAHKMDAVIEPDLIITGILQQEISVLSIALAYQIGEPTASNVIKEICNVLITILAPVYLRLQHKMSGSVYVIAFGLIGTFQIV